MNKSEFKEIQATAGSIAIMDANLIHTGSAAKYGSRWTIFNLFSHWHVKPYFDYPSIFSDSVDNFSEYTKKLLHFYSIPPLDENDRINTLTQFA